MPKPQIFTNEAMIGHAVAEEIVTGFVAASAAGRPYVLGGPSGRTPRSTYRALTELLRERTDIDASRLHIVMMDDYVMPISTSSRFVRVPAALPYSCERFGRDEILAPLVTAGVAMPERNLHFPEPADPGAYDEQITALGGIDLFVLASGASDGHVAFNPPGSSPDSVTRVVELSDETRTDNMLTFAPHFHTLDDVPHHGVTVGIDTIRRNTRRAIMLLIGDGKRKAAATIMAARTYRPDWPATIVTECENASLYLDRAAAGTPDRPDASGH